MALVRVDNESGSYLLDDPRPEETDVGTALLCDRYYRRREDGKLTLVDKPGTFFVDNATVIEKVEPEINELGVQIYDDPV